MEGGRGIRRLWVATAALALALTGTALAARSEGWVKLRVGDIVAVGHGGFAPEALPKRHDAPIELFGGGRLSTVSGKLPPILETIVVELDRHGHPDTTGLEVCTRGKLLDTDVPAARRACPGAIVGEGIGTAIVAFPEQKPFPVSSPITIFNGPKRHGDDTVLAHGHLNVPVPTTYIVPIVIERIHHGVYGYRVEAKIPPIAGGYGVPISGSGKIGRKWTYRGARHSYVNARCETGHLQARGEFTFKDGTFLTGTLSLPCKVR